jgi:tRNA G18 (ribose-2'-O)-methylase SpoU
VSTRKTAADASQATSSIVAARIVPVTSSEDPVLEPYARIRERDLRGREGLFIAESEVVVRVMIERSPFALRSLLLEKRRVAALEDVIAKLSEDVAVYVVEQSTMDAVTGFAIHRGVLALGERGAPIAPATLLTGPGPFVGLIGLTNHDNVGGIFRNAGAFGASAVLLDEETCDPLYRKAIRVSAGASLVVPFARTSSAHAMLDLFAREDVETIALTPKGEERIDALEPKKRRALILGTEGPGLPEEVLRRARRVRIDAPGLDSLNVAVASGIALFATTSR